MAAWGRQGAFLTRRHKSTFRRYIEAPTCQVAFQNQQSSRFTLTIFNGSFQQYAAGDGADRVAYRGTIHRVGDVNADNGLHGKFYACRMFFCGGWRSSLSFWRNAVRDGEIFVLQLRCGIWLWIQLIVALSR
ncbi:hypothetical protein TGPRC2_230205 [Toxoplasma gondii TgCatPRC2]|uniref:Uncharacterized protein n=1 Tax=Toxoplasma gondii TgCatPRC2 TaxID=1130821 RepID=A0A151HE91_TOXGO|nr:hypothetical protein TGPRC2_230205 [Toxoplasma gondii TgCatPRC2]